MNRSTLLLLALLLALGAVTYLLLPSGEERQASYESRGVHFAVDSASVMRIDIRRPLSTTTIQNVGGIWMVTAPFQFAADPGSVQQLIGGLAKFKVGSLVSSNPEKQRLFQVDSTGTFITVTDRAGASTQVVFGKMGPSFTEVYFRMPEAKDVYLGEGIDSWMLTREPKEWRDKTILAANTQAIAGIDYGVNGTTTSFRRDSSGWVSGGRRASLAALNPALTALMSLKAEDFIDTATEFHKTPLSVRIDGPDPVTLHLYPLDAESTRYAVQSSKTPQLFVVSKYTAGQLLAPTGRGALTTDRVEAPPVAEERAPARSVPPPVVKHEEKKPPPPEKVATLPARKPVTEQAPPKKGAPEAAPKQAVAHEPQTVKLIEKPSTPPQEQRVTPPPRTITPERKTAPVKEAAPAAEKSAPSAEKGATQAEKGAAGDDEGELTIVKVKKGETLTTIAKKYSVTVDQIIKWNQLKSISVKPGMELYVFLRK